MNLFLFSLEQLGVVAAVISAVVGAVAAIAHLWIRPIELKLEHLSFAIDRETQAVKRGAESLEQRFHQHMVDEERHVTADWRQDTANWRAEMLRRFDRLEDRLEKLK